MLIRWEEREGGNLRSSFGSSWRGMGLSADGEISNHGWDFMLRENVGFWEMVDEVSIL